jgi:hypothetical protein
VDQRFLSLLPEALQKVVADAENLVGSSLVVRSSEAMSEFDNVELRPRDKAGIAHAVITYRGDSITRCALVHEVLHIKRYWLEKVPILRCPVTSRFGFEALLIEELVEHLVIIPEERRFVSTESDEHWSAVLDQKIREISPLPADRSEAERATLQRNVYRAMFDIALPHLDNSLLYERLGEAEELEASHRFVGALRPLVSDKLQALSFIVATFRYEGFRAAPIDLDS